MGGNESSCKIPARCRIWSFDLLIWFLSYMSVGLKRSELYFFLSRLVNSINTDIGKEKKKLICYM